MVENCLILCGVGVAKAIISSDSIDLLVEFIVTRKISAYLISQAMGAVTSIFSGRKDWFYKTVYSCLTVVSNLFTTIFISLILVPGPEKNNRITISGSISYQLIV